MASTFQKLKDLDLSRDEVERLGEALKKEEFRQLLKDYVQEVQSPENKKIYEEEITQLERERGIDVTFINPRPGYVIKTSVDGSKKCFINVCANENVQKPTSTIASKEGTRGLQWSIPHSLTPPREDIDNKRASCVVYDVVFHPDTFQMARNKSFQNLVNTTACEAIENNFNVSLDKKNLKFPKMQYKGMPQASIIRKPMTDFIPREMEPEEKEFFDKIYAEADTYRIKKPKKSVRKSEDKSTYTTPKYVIKHRSHVDIQDCVENKQAKIHAATPKELIIEIDLPLLKSSSDITLDVTEKTVQLISEKPSKYKLNLTLPYRVNQDNGNAKFDKDLKKLIITLPVKRSLPDYSRDDSGVDSDQGSPTTPLSEEDPCEKVFADSAYRTNFVEENSYELPEFTCHLFENTLAFTLNVKNVAESSISKVIQSSSLHIKFTSISTSFYEARYSFYVKLPAQNIVEDRVQVETWDNNVVVQIPFNCDKELEYYFYGLNDLNLKKKFLEEPSVLNSVLQNPIPEEPEETSSVEKLTESDDFKDRENVAEKSSAINIAGTSYESSGDELSCSFSPSKSRGILKRLSNRQFVGRSVSESSLDDMVCSSLDSTIPEDGEISASLKKTVRFSDVIMRQLYRSNSSILGQKKKNQRKARNKKRAQERRHSESEASEIDEKRDDDAQDNGNNESSDQADEKSDYINSDIFHMDMF